MQASLYIIVRNSIFMNFTIRSSSAWWSRACMVCVTALDIQVSLCNPIPGIPCQGGQAVASIHFSDGGGGG